MVDQAVRTRVREAGEGLRAAKVEYTEALLEARRAGLSNQKIGELLGVSETAVRMYLKRYRQRESRERSPQRG